MFWLGLAITIVGAFIGISLIRDWFHHIAGHNIDKVSDIIRVFLIILGAGIATLGYKKSQYEKNLIKEDLHIAEYDRYRIKDFDILISLSTSLDVIPGFYGNSNRHIKIDPSENIPSEIPGKYIGPALIDNDKITIIFSYNINGEEGVSKITIYKNNGDKLKHESIAGNLIESILNLEIDIENILSSREHTKIKGFWISFIVNDINIKNYYISEDRFHDLITLDKEHYSEEMASFKLHIKISEIFQNSDEIRQMYKNNLKQLEAKGCKL